MYNVVLGVLGAVSALALYWCGFVMGWLVSRKVSPPAPPVAGKEEQQRQQRVQDAMMSMLTYSPDVAYGSRRGGDEDG